MSVEVKVSGNWKRVSDVPGQLSVKTVAEPTDDYTILDDDGYELILVSTGMDNSTITLPEAANNSGRTIKIVKTDNGSGKVVVDGDGGETINGRTSIQLGEEYDFIEVVCNGSIWLLTGTRASHSTGWVSCSDWTNQHLGDTVGGNINHNLNTPLSDLLVRVLISTDGTDANSFEVSISQHDNASAAAEMFGITIFQVDTNNIKVQTGTSGAAYYAQDDGTGRTLNTENWYYKVKVWYLG